MNVTLLATIAMPIDSASVQAMGFLLMCTTSLIHVQYDIVKIVKCFKNHTHVMLLTVLAAY